MKITKLFRTQSLNYSEDIARANGHIQEFNQGGVSLEWDDPYSYEAEDTADGIMAIVRYYQKRGYGIIPLPDEFMPENTVNVNHKIKMVHFNCQVKNAPACCGQCKNCTGGWCSVIGDSVGHNTVACEDFEER